VTLIESWNTALFIAINASAAPPQAALLFARGLAIGAPFIAALMLVLLWIRRDRATRSRLLDATLAAGIGLTIAKTITLLWYHPRPFELGIGHQLMAHLPEASFPSDHATLLFGMALPLLLAKGTRGLGSLFTLLALGAAWARVYLGVHFPFDMVGGLGVALLATMIVLSLRKPLQTRVYPPLFRLYETILTLLRLPVRLFPREG